MSDSTDEQALPVAHQAVYDLTFLELGFVDPATAAASVCAALRTEGAQGTVLGCFRPETGPLNHLLLIRGFPSPDALFAERRRMMRGLDPFGCGDVVTGIRTEGYALFPGFPPPTAGEYGPLYELRTYGVNPGRLAELMDQWSRAREQRAAISPFLFALYALDGRPRITHLWGYRDFDQRQAARTAAARTGDWPPPAGRLALRPSAMSSSLYLPTPQSPLR